MRCGAAMVMLAIFASLSFAAVNWVFTSPGPLLPDVAVMPSSIVAGSNDGSVYSISSANGALEWTYSAGEPVDISPCVLSATEVAVAARSGKVTILSSSGKELASFAANSSPTSIACGGKRVFVSSKGVISAWTNLGKNVWNASLDSASGPLGLYGKTLYFASGKKLRSLSSITGEQNWASDAEDMFISRPVEDGESVLMGATDGRVYSFNRQNGAPKWSFLAGGWIVSTPLFYDDKIYFGSTDGRLYAITDFANPVFEFPAGEGVWSSPLLHPAENGNIVVFGSTDGKLYGIDSNSGNRVWSFSTSGRINSPQESGGSFVFTTDHGKVYSISSSPMCGFVSPGEGTVVGPWIIEAKGSAHSDTSLSGVDVRVSGGPWISAAGTDSWRAEIDMAPQSDGPVAVECRARDSNGASENGEYASLVLVKLQSAPLREMDVESRSRVGQKEKFDITVKDPDGEHMRGFTIASGGENKTGDSPYQVSFARGGSEKITITKSGYAPVSFTVIVAADELPVLPIAGGFALLVALVLIVRFVFFKKS